MAEERGAVDEIDPAEDEPNPQSGSNHQHFVLLHQ